MVHSVEYLESCSNANPSVICLWVLKESSFLVGSGSLSFIGGCEGDPAKTQPDKETTYHDGKVRGIRLWSHVNHRCLCQCRMHKSTQTIIPIVFGVGFNPYSRATQPPILCPATITWRRAFRSGGLGLSCSVMYVTTSLTALGRMKISGI